MGVGGLRWLVVKQLKLLYNVPCLKTEKPPLQTELFTQQCVINLHHTEPLGVFFPKPALVANLNQLLWCLQSERRKCSLNHGFIASPLFQSNQFLNPTMHPLTSRQTPLPVLRYEPFIQKRRTCSIA